MKSALKLFTLLLIILSTSCKKEIEDKQNKILLLTKPAGWVTLKVEEKSTTGTWTDITANIGAFEADNVLIFDPYYDWAISEGALKFPGSPQITASGDWYFLEKETKIQLREGTTLGNLFEIVELTETSFQILVNSNGKTYRYTYKHP